MASDYPCDLRVSIMYVQIRHPLKCLKLWHRVLLRARVIKQPTYTKHSNKFSWWRHQMEIFSALLAFCAGNSPVTGEFPIQRPVTRSFDIFFSLRLNKRLSKQSWGWWFETLSRPLWRHCNVTVMLHRRPGVSNRRGPDWFSGIVQVNIKENIRAQHYSSFPLQRDSNAERVAMSWRPHGTRANHYNDDIRSAMASQITSLTIVYSIVYLGADQRKHQSSAPLAFVRGIHRSPVNSPHKGPVARKKVPFDDVIMHTSLSWYVDEQ